MSMGMRGLGLAQLDDDHGGEKAMPTSEDFMSALLA
jgi:hypothetical protein